MLSETLLESHTSWTDLHTHTGVISPNFIVFFWMLCLSLFLSLLRTMEGKEKTNKNNCTTTDLSSFHSFNPTHSWISYFPYCSCPCTVLLINCQVVIKHVYINILRGYFSPVGTLP